MMMIESHQVNKYIVLLKCFVSSLEPKQV